jgi:hypothetical protein
VLLAQPEGEVAEGVGVMSALLAAADAARVLHQEGGDGTGQRARHVGGGLARRHRRATDGPLQRGQRRQHGIA